MTELEQHESSCCAPQVAASPAQLGNFTQAPPTHVSLAAHEMPALCQAPRSSHDSGLFPFHRLLPGVQTPWHAPAMHDWFEHGIEGPHAPWSVHVSTELPAHRVCPALHT